MNSLIWLRSLKFHCVYNCNGCQFKINGCLFFWFLESLKITLLHYYITWSLLEKKRANCKHWKFSFTFSLITLVRGNGIGELKSVRHQLFILALYYALTLKWYPFVTLSHLPLRCFCQNYSIFFCVSEENEAILICIQWT